MVFMFLLNRHSVAFGDFGYLALYKGGLGDVCLYVKKGGENKILV